MKYHANAKLTLRARRDLVERMQAGWTAGDIADQMNVSVATVYKWWRRWRTEGDAGLWDRSSRPRSCPRQTPRAVERRIERIRTNRKLGPARIAGIVEMHPSTVHRVLHRQGLSRLEWMDRPTGRVVRRIVTSRPGELVHVDTKKLHQVPAGGGWRAHGRGVVPQRDRITPQLDYVHSVIDAFSRVAYVEVWPDETGETCTAVFERAVAWFAERGVTVEAVLSDNGPGYRSRRWRDICQTLEIEHRRIRPYTPRTNGKVERFNRTLQEEWATHAPTSQTTNDSPHLPAGFTPTTITDATPRSEATHPSAASTTSQGITTSADSMKAIGDDQYRAGRVPYE